MEKYLLWNKVSEVLPNLKNSKLSRISISDTVMLWNSKKQFSGHLRKWDDDKPEWVDSNNNPVDGITHWGIFPPPNSRILNY